MRYTVEVDEHGRIRWYKEGTEILHREDGPAVEFPDGYKAWYINGLRHRQDGPAIEHIGGTKEWFINGKYHREDGPAVEHAGGYKAWYKNGKRHREDGPAIERANGTKEYWINSKELSEEEFKQRTQKSSHNNPYNIEKFLIEENHQLRKAGCKLAETALYVAREHDGIHRLLLAVSEWSLAVANEGRRGKKSVKENEQ